MRLRPSCVLVAAVAITLAAAGTGQAVSDASSPNFAPQLVGLDLAFQWTAVPGLAETPCGMAGRSVISDPKTPNGRGPITVSTARSPHGWHVATNETMQMSLNWTRSVGRPTNVRFLTGGFAITKPNGPVISAGFVSGLVASCPVQAPRQAPGKAAGTYAIRVPLDTLPNLSYVGTVCAFVHITGGPRRFTETVKFAKALSFYSDKPRTSPC